jgi:hypothetical protein
MKTGETIDIGAANATTRAQRFDTKPVMKASLPSE